MFGGQGFQEMKGAMISATIERPWEVRVNNENPHSVVKAPERLVGTNQIRKATGACFQLGVDEREKAGAVSFPQKQRQNAQEPLPGVARIDQRGSSESSGVDQSIPPWLVFGT